MNNLKRECRAQIKLKLENLSQKDKEFKSRGVAAQLEKLFSHYLSIENFVLGAFAPMSDEPYWPYLLETKGEVNFKTAFPLPSEEEGGMSFLECRFEDLIKERAFGVNLLVPPRVGRKIVPDVFLVPGLAFTKAGERLGRGKGYYDRYLSNLKGARIGICFEEQLLSELPIDELDQRMNFVITEKNIYQTHNVSGSFKE